MHVGRGAAQRIDAAADQAQLAVADDDVAVGELHLAGADGLDLPALEHHAGLVALLDVVVEAGLAVLGDRHRGLSDGAGAATASTIAPLYEARQEIGAALVLAARDVRPGDRRRGSTRSSCPGASAPRCSSDERRRHDGAPAPGVLPAAPCLHHAQRARAGRARWCCELVDGPFSLLDGLWQFVAARPRRRRGEGSRRRRPARSSSTCAMPSAAAPWRRW